MKENIYKCYSKSILTLDYVRPEGQFLLHFTTTYISLAVLFYKAKAKKAILMLMICSLHLKITFMNVLFRAAFIESVDYS